MALHSLPGTVLYSTPGYGEVLKIGAPRISVGTRDLAEVARVSGSYCIHDCFAKTEETPSECKVEALYEGSVGVEKLTIK